MKAGSIQAQNDSLEFIFHRHETGLRRLAAEWFAEKLATASPPERRNLAERAFVRGENPGGDFARCRFRLSLQRTLRVPDDGREYPLPAGLGRLPLRNIRVLQSPAIPAAWRTVPTGLVCLHPAEAAWISFRRGGNFAVQVAAGGICAVSGRVQEKALGRAPQNYVVSPEQPWLDGFRVSPAVVRQFVAMPLGRGFTAEHQVTGREQHGGLQLRVVPPRLELVWEKEIRPECEWRWRSLIAPLRPEGALCGIEASTGNDSVGLGAGGRIRQTIYADPHPAGMWDEAAALDCELQLIDARHWTEFTGEETPAKPPTPGQYAEAGIPWFDYTSPAAPLADAAPLAKIQSVGALFTGKTGLELPENDPLEIDDTITLGP